MDEGRNLSDFSASLAVFDSISDAKVKEIKRAVQQELKLPPDIARRPILLNVDSTGDQISTITVIDQQTGQGIAAVKVDRKHGGRVFSVMKFQAKIDALKPIPTLSQQRNHLLNFRIIEDAEVEEIKAAVRRELNLDPQIARRPIILTVETTSRGITTIEVTDKATLREIGTIKLDQNREGRIVGITKYTKSIRSLMEER